VAHRQALDSVIGSALSTMTADAAAARLQGLGIANARMNTMAEFVQHPQLAARDRWRSVDSEAGPIDALLPPFNIDSVEPVMGAVPALGQHTEAILMELGYDANAIAAWQQAGVV